MYLDEFKKILSPIVSTDISTQSFTCHSIIAAHFVKSGAFWCRPCTRSVCGRLPDSEEKRERKAFPLKTPRALLSSELLTAAKF